MSQPINSASAPAAAGAGVQGSAGDQASQFNDALKQYIQGSFQDTMAAIDDNPLKDLDEDSDE